MQNLAPCALTCETHASEEPTALSYHNNKVYETLLFKLLHNLSSPAEISSTTARLCGMHHHWLVAPFV